jgi:hypothetical protein
LNSGTVEWRETVGTFTNPLYEIVSNRLYGNYLGNSTTNFTNAYIEMIYCASIQNRSGGVNIIWINAPVRISMSSGST